MKLYSLKIILGLAVVFFMNTGTAHALTEAEAKAKVDEYLHDRAEHIVRSKNAMEDRNDEIFDDIEDWNRDNDASPALKDLDELYQNQMREIAKSGDVNLWNETRQAYIQQREALIKDQNLSAPAPSEEKKTPPSWGEYEPYQGNFSK